MPFIDRLYFTKDGEIEGVQIIEEGVEARVFASTFIGLLCLGTGRRVSGIIFTCSWKGVMFQVPIRLKISDTLNQ